MENKNYTEDKQNSLTFIQSYPADDAG